MYILKSILLVIVSIILVLLVIALFVKKGYSIERSIVINKPRSEVFDYVRFVKNQDNYSKWVMLDPLMKKDFEGTDGTVGFKYAWDSKNKNVGKGEQEITAINAGEKIELTIHFIRPFEGIAKTLMTTETEQPNQTRLTWGMTGKNVYPFNITNLFMDGMLGMDITTSLVQLKAILER